MARLNRSQFAELVGVNEGVIRRAIKRGRVVVGEDNLIESDTQVARWHATRDDSKVRETSGQRGRPAMATGSRASTLASRAFIPRKTVEMIPTVFAPRIAAAVGADLAAVKACLADCVVDLIGAENAR